MTGFNVWYVVILSAAIIVIIGVVFIYFITNLQRRRDYRLLREEDKLLFRREELLREEAALLSERQRILSEEAARHIRPPEGKLAGPGIDEWSAMKRRQELREQLLKGNVIRKVPPVTVTAFTPELVEQGSSFVLDIWAYPSDQFEQVSKRAEAVEKT